MALLDLRPICECCDIEGEADSTRLRICTLCADCAVSLNYRCPNCEANLVERPLRPTDDLSTFPVSVERVISNMDWPHK